MESQHGNLEVLRGMIDRDPLHQLHEQEKEMIWNLRYECREHFPHSLPKLLSCVHWNNYIDVATVGGFPPLLGFTSELQPSYNDKNNNNKV